MTGIHSGKDGPFGQDFSMIMQESSGSDCPMGMSFSGKGVNPSYTLWAVAGPHPTLKGLLTVASSP